METNGLILVWYHSEREPPQWQPLPIPPVNQRHWVYQGRNEYHVTCHVQDISENGADPAHLDAVHSTSILCGGEPSSWAENLFSGLVGHHWDIEWKPLKEPEGHRAEVRLQHTMKLVSKWNLFSLQASLYNISSS